MTTVKFSQAVTTTSDPTVARHDITFVMELVSLNGEPVKENTRLYDATSVGDESLYTRLPREVSNWSYIDNYEVECQRAEVYQPEFGSPDDVSEDVSTARFYEIAVGASHELPATQADETEVHALSVERLLAEVPGKLVEIYAQHGLELRFIQAKFYKKYEHTQSGHFTLTPPSAT